MQLKLRVVGGKTGFKYPRISTLTGLGDISRLICANPNITNPACSFLMPSIKM